MEDLFYVTKESLTLDDIAAVAVTNGYRCERHEGSGFVSLEIADEQGPLCQWSLWGEDDLTSFETPQQEKLAAYAPTSLFGVGYHANDLLRVALFLEPVLTRFGGWVGCDDGTFEVTWDASSIHQIRCPV